MKPRLGRARRPRPLVVLTPGWSGEAALVRLLAADGSIRSSGYWLSYARHKPEARLRALLRARTNEAVHCVLVQPSHLWAINNLDPFEAVARLVDDGIAVMSLERRSKADCGLSQTLCGPDGEVLPTTPQVVEPARMLVNSKNAELAAEWLDQVTPRGSPRLVFEDDLVDTDARRETIARVAAFLGLQPWDAPVEEQLPSAAALWDRVANPDQLRQTLAQLTSSRSS